MSNKSEIILFGPSRIIKNQNNEIVDYVNPHILNVNLKLNDITYDLQHNKITIKKNNDGTVFIYHMYDYIYQNICHSGRWYNTKFDLQSHLDGHELSVTIDDYEDEDTGKICSATFTISLLPNSIK
jgi:hypothetical protein